MQVWKVFGEIDADELRKKQIETAKKDKLHYMQLAEDYYGLSEGYKAKARVMDERIRRLEAGK